MKPEACGFADGIHRKELYIYWPGEYPQVDEFLKYKGKLYYFIHKFPSALSLSRYQEAWNSPYSKYGFIRNSPDSRKEMPAPNDQINLSLFLTLVPSS